MTCPPSYQGVRHVHHNNDERFWLLEGLMDLEADGNHTKMRAGGDHLRCGTLRLWPAQHPTQLFGR